MMSKILSKIGQKNYWKENYVEKKQNTLSPTGYLSICKVAFLNSSYGMKL